MTSYRVVWRRSAERELRSLPREWIARVVALAESLADDPRPRGCRKLSGAERTYRFRTGDYRLVYTVEDDRLVIEVVRVGHRREVYRRGP